MGIITGSIRVYCRVRPFLPGQTSSLTTVDHIEESTISIATPSKYGKEGRKSFTFNKVFGPSASQGNDQDSFVVYTYWIHQVY